MPKSKHLLPVRLPADVYETLRAYSAVVGSSMNNVSAEAINEYLGKHLSSEEFESAHDAFERRLDSAAVVDAGD